MLGYLLNRLLQSIIFIFLAALAVYTVLVHLMPGGVKGRYQMEMSFHEMAGLTEEEVLSSGDTGVYAVRLAKQYKLNEPWPLNYLLWLFDSNDTTQLNEFYEEVPKGLNVDLLGLKLRGSGILTGDIGRSEGIASGVSVMELLGDRWDHTALLVLYSLVITIVVALPLGITGAVRHRSAPDHAITFFSFGGQSIPPFVLGLLFIIFLSVLPTRWHMVDGVSWMPFMPPGGLGDRNDWADRFYHMTLPALTLAVPQIAWLSRYTRFAMLEVLSSNYIRTAWAKGLARRRVIFKHALRNTLLPVITLTGLAVPAIASSAIVVETVFGYPGLGQLFYRALGGCLATSELRTNTGWGLIPPPCPAIGYYEVDYPVAITMTILLAGLITFAALLSDILYAAADPRVNLRAKQNT
jgi:peptide/nickel transport system permease protein